MNLPKESRAFGLELIELACASYRLRDDDIHGAIIAREYGLPCVTGIPDADRVISTGNHVTVDGYLGIVTINRNSK